MPGNSTTILSGVVGSTAYGLAHEGSDVDRLGVFMFDADDLFSMDRPATSVTTSEPDVTWHELGKFLGLALACNPSATELLWLDHYEDIDAFSGIGARLIQLRQAFLSGPRVLGSYLEYATMQIAWVKRHSPSTTRKSDPRVEKHIRHAFRLLEQGHKLYTTGVLDVQVVNPKWYLETLPTLSLSWIFESFDVLAANFRRAETVLPDLPDGESVNQFLIQARCQMLAPTAF